MKKLYSLTRNDQEIVSVEMDVPDFMPRTTLNREWLKGVVTEEVRTKPSAKARRRNQSHRIVRPDKVAA